MLDPYSLCRWISAEVDSQFAYKISDFRYPLFTGNEMLCYKERHPLLLKCIIQFLICTGMLRGALKSIRTRLNDGTMSFLPKTTVQFHAKVRFLAPSKHTKWDTMIQGETSIATWVVHNLPQMYHDDWRSFGQHIWAYYGPRCIISAETNSQISCKILDFGYPPSRGNGVLRWKEKEIHFLLSDSWHSLDEYGWDLMIFIYHIP